MLSFILVCIQLAVAKIRKIIQSNLQNGCKNSFKRNISLHEPLLSYRNQVHAAPIPHRQNLSDDIKLESMTKAVGGFVSMNFLWIPR